MNLKVISRNVGYALLVSAFFMFISVIVSVLNGNDSALAALIISFTITFVVGVFPFIFVRKNAEITMKDGYMIIFLSWMLSFIFGMLPYALWGGPFTIINAWFESVSGYTTTGATILTSVEDLPKSLLFWRSSTHFIGGLGVVVFLLLIIPNTNNMRMRLANMELSSLSRDYYMSKMNKTIHIFTYMYLGLTFAAFVAYMIAGMSTFEAINHAFSVCATGGFSTRNFSIASFNSLPVTIVTMVFMFAASVHFGILYLVFATRSLKSLNNSIFKYYVATLIFAIIFTTISFRMENVYEDFGKCLLNSSFNVLSYASTTGFAISDNSAWPYFPSMFLMVLGIQCGMAGSTTGGLKADRIFVIFKAVRQQIMRTIHPSYVSELRVKDRLLRDEEITPHILYVCLYSFIIILSVLACLSFGVDSQNAFMATISCIGNVGPAVGKLGTFGNYNLEPSIAKFIYTADMFLGRVEIYPILAVFSMMFTNRRK